MLKVNYLNVTLWVLVGVLLLVLLGVIIWRLTTKDEQKSLPKSERLVLSKKLIELAKSLKAVYDVSSLINILFKNKFAKSKFSLITLLAFTKQNAYLILNPLKIDPSSKFSISNSQIHYTFKNKSKKLDMQPTQEILRFFKAMDLKVEVIIPTDEIDSNQKFKFMPLEEIGDYIKLDKKLMNPGSIAKHIAKIAKLNIFKRKTTKRGIDA